MVEKRSNPRYFMMDWIISPSGSDIAEPWQSLNVNFSPFYKSVSTLVKSCVSNDIILHNPEAMDGTIVLHDCALRRSESFERVCQLKSPSETWYFVGIRGHVLK